jgi:hypothetical protein
MRLLLSVLVCLLVFSGCKKAVEKAKENALMDLITNGQWKVSRYTKGTVNVTSNFIDYKFQFHSNGTVDAIKNGSFEKSGTWAGNLTTRTIDSYFSNANETLTLLNGTWQVKKTSSTHVESSQQADGETRMLRLDKL